jgi:putative membrane protein
MLSIGIATILTPGFRNRGGCSSLFLGAVVMAALNYFVLDQTGIQASAFGRGAAGFFMAAAIIYVTGKLVPGYRVSLFGALVGAVVLSAVNIFLPGPFM